MEGAFEIYRKFNLTPEIVKENMMEVLDKNNLCQSLKSLSTSEKSKYNRFYNKKFKSTVTKKKGTKTKPTKKQDKPKPKSITTSEDQNDEL